MARVLGDSLANISAQAERRLDKLAGTFPKPQAQAMKFDEYLPRALAYAQQDEKFARELAQALHTASMFGG